jgi:hypothetical protein
MGRTSTVAIDRMSLTDSPSQISRGSQYACTLGGFQLQQLKGIFQECEIVQIGFDRISFQRLFQGMPMWWRMRYLALLVHSIPVNNCRVCNIYLYY